MRLKTRLARQEVLASVFILVFGLLIAGGISAFAPAPGDSPISVRWTERVGEGIAVPACSSSAPSVTCENDSPKVSISFTPDPSEPCISFVLFIDGISDNVDTVSCTSSEVTWGGASNNTAYTYHIYRNDGIVNNQHSDGTFTTTNCAPAVNGACGTADGQTYSYGSTSYGSDTQCSSGSPSSTAFPAAGETQTWTCSGANGGSDSGTCSASQKPAPVNGVCSSTHYSCVPGTSVSNSDNTSTWTWTCNGSYGGTNASCTERKPPSLTNVTINSDPATDKVRADGSKQYAITVTATDPAGGDSIVNEYAMVNYQGVNQGAYRGYPGWSLSSESPYYFTSWGGNFKAGTPIACIGGGRGAIYNGGFGPEYINLHSCSSSVSGNTRTSTFTVSFNENFTSPLSGNTLSGWTQNDGGRIDVDGDGGWRAFDTFKLAVRPAVTLSADPSTIDRGESTKLFWSATGDVSSCASTGGTDFTGGAVTNPSGGASTGTLTETATFGIICSGLGGTSLPSYATVTVLQPEATISATPDRLPPPPSPSPDPNVVVNWIATNINECSVTRNGESWITQTATSSRTINWTRYDTVTTQTVYFISCTNNGNVATSTSKIVNMTSGFQEF